MKDLIIVASFVTIAILALLGNRYQEEAETFKKQAEELAALANVSNIQAKVAQDGWQSCLKMSIDAFNGGMK